MDWNREMEDRLRQLWTQDSPQLSAQEIGRQLRVSKNAVIGKARRLGLPSRQSPIGRSGPKPEKWETVQRGEARVWKRRAEPQPKKAEEPKEPSAPVQRVPLRAKDGCSWVFGDPRREWRFCDAPRSALGGAYCDKHRAIVYRPFEKRAG